MQVDLEYSASKQFETIEPLAKRLHDRCMGAFEELLHGR